MYQNKSPEFVRDTPYNVAVVQLEEGPRMMSNIVETDPAELRVDLPVTVVFDAVNDDIHLPRFKAL
ncbi:MAG: OB-fold domain-containing protein [Chloroflexota bacterium]|nr:MAG: OB-fold domain-containing protein [Chloroflexota bacterium]